jgi:hypothetical protein
MQHSCIHPTGLVGYQVSFYQALQILRAPENYFRSRFLLPSSGSQQYRPVRARERGLFTSEIFQLSMEVCYLGKSWVDSCIDSNK